TNAAPTATPAAAVFGAELLFLRAGDLYAFDLLAAAERMIATDVRDVAVSSDGAQLALVREVAGSVEIWLIGRDGADPRQLTTNSLIEGGLQWSPVAESLLYTASTVARPHKPDWENWSRWCVEAEVRLIDTAAATPAEQVIGSGCDAAFAPDGTQIAFSSPPQQTPLQLAFVGETNSIQVVDRDGANGQTFAQAGANDDLLVYGAAWTPDGAQLAYQRFLGYRALVDLNLTELQAMEASESDPLGIGAGWMLKPQFSPDGRLLMVTEHDFSSARGGSGYDLWATTILRLGEPRQVYLPSGEVEMQASEQLQVRRAVAGAWSPDSAQAALLLPSGWNPDLDPFAELFPGEAAGEIWIWDVERADAELLLRDVDFASSILWLAPTGG
ncbi:MAG: hypothetical protein HC822_25565, partial [Oscillochloris sp.]|nr:hypothetical protein [Oscillochloris sp.]